MRRGRVGSPSASGHHTREGGDSDDEHSHKLATAADGGRAHGGGRCWTCSHDLLIAIVRGEKRLVNVASFIRRWKTLSRQPRSLIRATPG